MKEKSKKKSSFLIYRSDRPMVETLTDQQAGMLFKSLFAFADTEEIVSIPDAAVNAFYQVMIGKMMRDNQKYEERCEQNRKNQLERWNKEQIRKLQEKKKMLLESGFSTEAVDRELKDAIEKSGIPPDTNVYGRIQANTKHTDRDIDRDTDRESDSDTDMEIDSDRGAGGRGRKNQYDAVYTLSDELPALRKRFIKMAKQKLSKDEFSEVMNHVLYDVSQKNPNEQIAWFKEKISTMGG